MTTQSTVQFSHGIQMLSRNATLFDCPLHKILSKLKCREIKKGSPEANTNDRKSKHIGDSKFLDIIFT